MNAWPSTTSISRPERIIEKVILGFSGLLFWPLLGFQLYKTLVPIQSIPHCLQVILAILVSALIVLLAAMVMIGNLPGHKRERKALREFNARLKTFQFPLKSLFFFPQLYLTSIEGDVLGLDIELNGQRKIVFVGAVGIKQIEKQIEGEKYLVQFPDATWSSGQIIARRAIITTPHIIDLAPFLVPNPLTKHPIQVEFP